MEADLSCLPRVSWGSLVQDCAQADLLVDLPNKR